MNNENMQEVTEEVTEEIFVTEDAANKMVNEIVCPHCQGVISIERPTPQRRGQLAGIDLIDMTDSQLRREIINAKSVLYKAAKRNAEQATIDKNQARVDAAMAEKARRAPVAVAVAVESTEQEAAEAIEGNAEAIEGNVEALSDL